MITSRMEKAIKVLSGKDELAADEQIIIFGTGGAALKICKKINNISFFVDNNKKKWNTTFLSKQVYSPDKLLEVDKDNIIIIVASMFYDEILQQLTDMGFVNEVNVFNGISIQRLLDTVKQYGELKCNAGYCPVCGTKSVFVETGEWLRDNYFCVKCNSIPRQRALMYVLSLVESKYYEKDIHESSPCGSTFSALKKKCKNYTYSYYFSDIKTGEYKDDARCENLQNMTFEDDSFDIFITQDVFEHIFNPQNAFKEIARVLRKGGVHIFTVPYKVERLTTKRSKIVDEKIVNILPPVYHGDPINSDGCIVVTDWGKDICDYIYQCSGLTTTIYCIKDRNMGIDGEYLEVFVSRK